MKIAVSRREKRVARIDFCCGTASKMYSTGLYDLAEDGEEIILLGRFQSQAGVQHHKVSHCLGCGARVDIEDHVRITEGR